MRAKLRRVLLWPDTHTPYHDHGAVEALITAASKWKPDVLVVLGDFFDFYAVSQFDKDPARKHLLVEEAAAGQALLKDLTRLSKERYFLAGNHEARLERYIAQKAPALHGLVKTTRDIVGPDWTYLPYRKMLRIGRLNVTHDLGNAGPGAPREALRKLQATVAMGHTHRLQQEYGGTLEGRRHCAMTCGWLGDFDAVDYMHESVARTEWTHGCGAGYIDAQGDAYLRAVPYEKGRFYL